MEHVCARAKQAEWGLRMAACLMYRKIRDLSKAFGSSGKENIKLHMGEFCSRGHRDENSV